MLNLIISLLLNQNITKEQFLLIKNDTPIFSKLTVEIKKPKLETEPSCYT